ncbi:AI-2E family transporter [Dehalogenimonas etheniformans]|uniref:AI-2E family transporter n=1 Tax=Dehalogenimonas etheniformans TaxID=1536648 RepID=A0A2P5P9Q3_9CHLR|nr:AI-2E family transporter [Dehalogenimonas etheniformans]PPD59004.1 AI-2E family transporter [Dehalogenimonas etheniformans]QNT76229.1 AI-2E family transporter [Dehalogenimonas etheniformans]
MQIRHILSRHWRSVVFFVCLIVFSVVVYKLRSVLLPFMIGLLIAYILRPVVLWLEKYTLFPTWLQKQKRAIIVLILFIFIAIFLVIVVTYTVALTANTVSQLFANAGDIINSVTSHLSNWLNGLREHLSPEIRARIDDIVAGASTSVSDAVKNTFQRSISLVPATIGFIFGFAIMPVFVFYLLKDWEKIRDGIYKELPAAASIHTRNILGIVGRVLGRYLRAELVLGSIVGGVTFIALLIMGVNFPLALFLGLLAGFFEAVPTIGPWISGFFAAVLILATYPELIFWVIGLFLVVQLLENNLLVPRIQGDAQRIHPALSLVLLILGAYFAGLWGIILAIPLTATIIRIFQYTEDAARFEDHLPLRHHDPAIFEK